MENVAKISNTPLDKLLVVEDTGLSKSLQLTKFKWTLTSSSTISCCLIRLTKKTLGKQNEKIKGLFRERVEVDLFVSKMATRKESSKAEGDPRTTATT